MASEFETIKSVVPRQAQGHSAIPGRATVSEVRATEGSAPVGATERVDERAAEEAVDRQSLDDVVSDLNTVVRELQRELRFTVDKDSGSTVIKVIDRETDEVVRQIPSEELVRLRERLAETAGVIFQDSA